MGLVKVVASEKLPIKSRADDLEELTLNQAKNLANGNFFECDYPFLIGANKTGFLIINSLAGAPG